MVLFPFLLTTINLFFLDWSSLTSIPKNSYVRFLCKLTDNFTVVTGMPKNSMVTSCENWPLTFWASSLVNSIYSIQSNYNFQFFGFWMTKKCHKIHLVVFRENLNLQHLLSNLCWSVGAIGKPIVPLGRNLSHSRSSGGGESVTETKLLEKMLRSALVPNFWPK